MQSMNTWIESRKSETVSPMHTCWHVTTDKKLLVKALWWFFLRLGCCFFKLWDWKHCPKSPLHFIYTESSGHLLTPLHSHIRHKKNIRIKINQRNISPTFQAGEVRYVTGILWWAVFVLLLRSTEITPGSWKNAPTSKISVTIYHWKITLENFCYFSNPVYIYKLYFIVLQCRMLNTYVITWLPNSRMLHQNIHLHTTDVPFPKTYN